MNQRIEKPVFMNWEATNLVSEISCQVEKCKAMIEHLYQELSITYDWEKSAPGRIELKNSLVIFADIAFDYAFDAFTKLEQIGEATQIIKAPVTDQSTQGATKNIQFEDTTESGKSQLGGF